MALHNLKIIVVEGGRSSNYLSKNNTNTNDGKNIDYKETPLYKLLNAKQTITKKIQSGMSPSSVFAMNMGIGVANQLIRQTANYYISDIGRKNGDSNYQSIINRQIEIVSDVVGFGSSVLSGAATGSMFGPLGATIGAALGVVSSGISLGFKYAERERAYQHEMFQESNNQVYNLTRANYSIWTGRAR